MLWYLHLCAVNGVVVTGYEDRALGTMAEAQDGSGQFTRVVLRPQVTVSAESDVEKALKLHEEAHRMCFLANSVRFAVLHEPKIARDFPG
jgi:organic hydroperoxide reductase OsmC/OhrA